jgi:hypothetical protein
MLIAQVDHAHISAELAERCRGPFSSEACASAPGKVNPLAAVRSEVLAAIRCHDDGWGQWERAPRLDPKLGRPLSFMELDHAESIAIWSRSIATAEAFGPLAAWMVAGHFLRLLNKSDSAQHEQSAVQWRDEMERHRDAWLHAWQAVDPVLRSRALADEALQWLWTFDEVSLWFCCICPNREGDSRTDAHAATAGQGTPVEMRLESSAEKDLGAAVAQPFRFDQDAIDIKAAGLVLPGMKYSDSAELQAAGQPTTIHWRLQSALLKNQ